MPAALGACWNSTVLVSPPWTPQCSCPPHTSPPAAPLSKCPPQWLMPAVSGPQMGAVTLDLLTPAGRRQQARCT